MTRYINQYPHYLAVMHYATYEEARAACGDDPMVKTIEMREIKRGGKP